MSQHTCIICSKEITREWRKDPSRGPLIYCSKSCSNSRRNSEAFRSYQEGVRENNRKLQVEKLCSNCNCSLPRRNKTGFCVKCFHEKNRDTSSIYSHHRYCLKCEKKISRGNTSGCCQKCLPKKYPNRKKDFVKLMKEEKLLGALNVSSKQSLKEYFLKKQDDKCCLCGIPNFWNGKPLMFILDHIDGHYKNNIESNLRLICSNCDSQLETYKIKNKGNGREYDREYKRKRAKKNSEAERG